MGEEPDLGADFPGEAYDPEFDHARLTGQLLRVYEAMADHEWRTIREIEEITGDPGPSVLAQLGHLRKRKFGAYTVEKRPRGRREDGLWEYRVGAKGSHTPRKPALLIRAEAAEAMAASLATALRELAPANAALKKYEKFIGKRVDRPRSPRRSRHVRRKVTRRPRELPKPRHLAPPARDLKRYEPKIRPQRSAQSKKTEEPKPARPQLTPEQKAAKVEALRQRDEERIRAASGRRGGP